MTARTRQKKTLGPLTMLKFTATWCGPCQSFAPVVHRWLAKHPEIALEEVDIDTPAGQKLAARHEVDCVPMIIFVADGVPVAGMEGAGTQRDLDALLKAARTVVKE